MSYKHQSQITQDEHAVISGVSGKKVFIIDSKGNILDFSGDSDFSTLIDAAASTRTYIGIAEPGTATSAASWQIKRIDSGVTTTLTDIEFADGQVSFDKVWDSRATYTYS